VPRLYFTYLLLTPALRVLLTYLAPGFPCLKFGSVVLPSLIAIAQQALQRCIGSRPIRQMFRLRTDVPGAHPTHAAFQVQPPTPTMAMGMTPMGMPMGMIQPEPAVLQAPLRPLKFIGLSGDGQPVSTTLTCARTSAPLARSPNLSVP
jgi:hypothetical protein